MGPHRFRVGQTVRFIKESRNSVFGATPVGNFRVVGLLPDDQGNNQYRVESASDGHQRAVIESEIVS